MRILVYFREQRFGGVHTYLKSQVAYLIGKGHDVWVSYSNGETRDMFAGLGARTFSNSELVRSLSRIDKDIKAIFRTYAFCKRNRIQCIFSHTSKGGAIARIAGFLARTPKRIHVIHGFSFHEHSKKMEKMLGYWAERILSALATKIISVNVEDRRLAISARLCKSGKIRTIRNGVPVPPKRKNLSFQEKAGFLTANGLMAEHKIVLFVGRLMKQKNPHYLVKAFAGIDHPSAHLVIIGEGPLKKNLQQDINERKMNHRIHLLGFRQDVDIWYQVCTVFVLPSLWEGMPMTLLEAMEAGACCVATDIKGNRECIKNNHDGFLIPCNNSHLLSNTISALLHNPGCRARAGAAARRKVIKEFTVRRMCEQTHYVLCQKQEVKNNTKSHYCEKNDAHL